MSSQQLMQKPDIKLSVKQTFDLKDMEASAFSKKANMSLKSTPITNLIKTQPFQS